MTINQVNGHFRNDKKEKSSALHKLTSAMYKPYFFVITQKLTLSKNVPAGALHHNNSRVCFRYV